MTASFLTLADWARRVDPDGTLPDIVEILNETNEVLDDMPWIMGNLPTGHRTTIRSGLPDVTWRLLYGGVQPSKSTTQQVDDTVGMLEAYSEVDVALAKLNGNEAAFRLSEDRAFLEAMSQEMAETLFYGDVSTDPEKFHGLAPRFSSTSAANGENIIRATTTDSGYNDYTSVWLVVWDPSTIHGIFPKGSKAGLETQDLGEQTAGDSTSGYYQVYRTHYIWKPGLSLRDWRYVVRIANIKCADLGSSGAPDLVDLMTQALDWVPSFKGRPVFYCNKYVRSYLRRQILNKDNVMLSFENVAGKKVLTFGEVPVKRVDAIKWASVSGSSSANGEDFVS